MTQSPMWTGFARKDGRKGIRNVVLVVYLVECAHHVARRIVDKADDSAVQLAGFPGCYPNAYAHRLLERLTTHPNVGSVLLVSLGCEGFDRDRLTQTIADSGRPVRKLVIQEAGGTRATIAAGLDLIAELQGETADVPRVAMGVHDLVVGTICGGSDGTSGITANPAAGRCFDRLVAEGAACIFEETGELIGCEQVMAERAVTHELGEAIRAAVHKAERYYTTLGYGS